MFEQKHGTLYSYNKLGCRCEECKLAKKNIRIRTPIKQHGTKWGYDKGCRCDECREAKASYRRKSHPNSKPPTTDVEKGTRKCITCKEIKLLEDFPKNRREFLGYNYSCKSCHNRISREHKNTPGHRFSTYKSSTKFTKVSFDLSFEEFMLFWNKPCHYCGRGIDGIGLDKKDPKNGYNLTNVVPCCWRCNKSKSNQTAEQFIEMCLDVAKNFKNYIVSPKLNLS